MIYHLYMGGPLAGKWQPEDEADERPTTQFIYAVVHKDLGLVSLVYKVHQGGRISGGDTVRVWKLTVESQAKWEKIKDGAQ